MAYVSYRTLTVTGRVPQATGMRFIGRDSLGVHWENTPRRAHPYRCDAGIAHERYWTAQIGNSGLAACEHEVEVIE